MALRRGYQIEEPAVFQPWGISEAQLATFLPAAHRVTPGQSHPQRLEEHVRIERP